jgi:hypothetical protein
MAVSWSARCLVCGWTTVDEVKRCDLDAEKHTKTTGHPTVQEGLPQ